MKKQITEKPADVDLSLGRLGVEDYVKIRRFKHVFKLSPKKSPRNIKQ